MTTPHAPEGEWVKQAVDDMRVVWSMDIPLFSRRECEDRLSRLIAAARADGATAERAWLAGLASEKDRAMVERVIHVAYNDGLCDAKQYARKFYQAERLGEALLARLAAARGEAVEEAARLCHRALRTIPAKSQAAAEVYHLAKQIRALFPPPGAEVGRG